MLLTDMPGNGLVFTAFEVLKLLVLLYYLVTLRNHDTKLPGPFLTISIIYQLSYIVPAIIYGTVTPRSLYLWIKETYSLVLLVLLLARFLQEDYKATICGLYDLLAVLAILHVILFYLFDIKLLGIRTRFADSTLIASVFLIVIILARLRRFRLIDFLFVVLSVFYVCEQWISTAVTLGALLAFAAVMTRYDAVDKFAKYNTLVVSALAVNYSLVVLRIQNAFKWLIVDILGEDLTMDGRTWIWDFAFKGIKEHNCFLGSGIAPDGSKDIHVAIYNEWNHLTMGDRQAHNQLVSVYYFNGLPGLLSYLALIFISGRSVRKLQDRKIAFILSIGMFLLCMGMVTELIADGYYFYLFLLVIYYSPLLNDAEAMRYE